MNRCVCRVVTAKSGILLTNELRTKVMNRTAHEVQTRVLESWQPGHRTRAGGRVAEFIAR